ncbi:protein FAM8A1 [Erpetoichthys calabaricus]|uniref:Family with sequence similarity 8 member A1b n=1 Tax=Erpetoichthys calabaricus TaxID=27687 RepID=A0A8C4SJJ2_ERPCA|nr:protein FAM8A1 [Erpetoichthys calabaricus]
MWRRVKVISMADAEEGLEKASAVPQMDNSKLRASAPREGQSSECKSSERKASEYCAKVQEWMWQCYWQQLQWHSWAAFAFTSPPHLCYNSQTPNQASQAPGWQGSTGVTDPRNWPNSTNPVLFPGQAPVGTPGQGTPATAPASARPAGQQHGNAPQAGREYTIPSPLHRFIAEMVDFFILFFIKAAIVLSIMHFSGMKDVSKFAMHYIVEDIDEDTSMEELQKMMIVALIYRVLVCFYEIICIWGAGGATPGKFLLGLRVVTCDTSVLVRPNRVLVIPASNVSMSASTVRALNKNFSIAFFFPAFITLLFFQHNRTVYDIVAGTIVVKRNGAR